MTKDALLLSCVRDSVRDAERFRAESRSKSAARISSRREQARIELAAEWFGYESPTAYRYASGRIK